MQFWPNPRVTGLMPLPGKAYNDVLPAEVLYRYHECRVGDRIHLDLERFEVKHETSMGYRVKRGYRGDTKWVPGTTEKRYAYPLKAQALYSFYRRKNRQVAILEYKLAMAKEARFVTPTAPVFVPFRHVLEREW